MNSSLDEKMLPITLSSNLIVSIILDLLLDQISSLRLVPPIEMNLLLLDNCAVNILPFGWMNFVC